ncbi:MAG: T9SS type A sorting domain-containing protein [candidate division WOR-3 bacterium]
MLMSLFIISAWMASLPDGTSGCCGDKGHKSGGARPAFYTRITLRGNYIQASVGLRFTPSGTLNLTGLPDGSGAYVAKAYLIYSVIASSSAPAMQIDGTPVSGQLVGTAPSPCWSDPNIYTYIADVTSIVRAKGDGVYTLSGYYNPEGDPPPGGTDGATLVAIYCERDYAGTPPRDIVIYLGAYSLTDGEECDTWGDITDLDTLQWTTSNFNATNPVTSAKLTLLFADGQDYWNGTCGQEIVRFNGQTLRQGATGLPGGNGNLYDAVHVENATSLIPGGSTSASNYFEVKWDESGCSGCVDCITAVGQILMVSSTNPETFDCLPLETEEGWVDKPPLSVKGTEVILSLPFPMWGELEVYSPTGQRVKTLSWGKLESGQWNLRSLGPGIYYIILRTEGFGASAKVVVR